MENVQRMTVLSYRQSRALIFRLGNLREQLTEGREGSHQSVRTLVIERG